MTTRSEYYEDEIDFKEVAVSILRYKWFIIALPIVLAITAGVYSILLMPKQFQAKTLVLITKPSLTTNFDPRITTTDELPDTKALTDLALADDLVSEVLETPEVQQAFDEPINREGLANHMKVSLVGTGQLRLQVNDTDPARAALIANVWADRLVARLNNLYGSDESSLTKLEEQISKAYDKWVQTQQALVEKIPENKTESLQILVTQKEDALRTYLDREKELDLIIADAQNLQDRLKDQPASQQVRIEDSLSLISLNQRAVQSTVQGTSNLQIQISTLPNTGNENSVSDARANLQRLISSLQSEKAEVQTVIANTQSEISKLAVQLETANNEKSQLTLQRDLAQTSYQALSNQAEETKITLSQNDSIAKIAGRALPPNRPNGPQLLLSIAVAGALGLILSIGFVLVREWWRSP